jgi:hypothetical protein
MSDKARPNRRLTEQWAMANRPNWPSRTPSVAHDREHCRVAGDPDRHGIPGRERRWDLDDPIPLDARLLRIATMVCLTQSPSIDDHLVTNRYARMRRTFNRASQVDARNQRGYANDLDRPLRASASL